MGAFCGFPQDRKASVCAGFCVYPDEYRPRQPRSTPLFRLLDSHYEEFRNVYDERFSKRYGFWRPVTDEVVEKYLQCGDPHYGFARIHCKECGAEYLIAFSCKCRGFCPSCSKRKSLDLAIFLEEELFRSVPHRHWVWSVPKMLRLHFLYHRKLLPKLCRCAWESLTMFLQEVLDRKDVFPGGILVPQTFGGMANWNPHVHALITDTCWDKEGNCYTMPEIDTADVQVLEKLFAGLVFRMLLKENMNLWKHSGHSVHCGKPVKADDTNGRKTLSKYISHPIEGSEAGYLLWSVQPRHGAAASAARVSYRQQQPKRIPPFPYKIVLHAPAEEDSCGLHFSRKSGT